MMTIREVAELAGVSPAAVSRYMNGGPLSKEKRDRIAQAISETGYRPNLTARTMRTGIVRQIGVIAPRINSDSVSEIMAGISETLGSHEYMPVLGNSDYRDLLELQYLDSMEMIRVAGIILMGRGMTPQLEEALGKLKVPVVITGQDHPGYACVFHDDFHAMRDLTCRMLERGRRDLVYLGVTEEDPAAGLARRMCIYRMFRTRGHAASRCYIRGVHRGSPFRSPFRSRPRGRCVRG